MAEKKGSKYVYCIVVLYFEFQDVIIASRQSKNNKLNGSLFSFYFIEGWKHIS